MGSRLFFKELNLNLFLSITLEKNRIAIITFEIKKNLYICSEKMKIFL